MGDFEDTWFLRGFKSSEKPASQAEASPQQAESLAAVVRPVPHNPQSKPRQKRRSSKNDDRRYNKFKFNCCNVLLQVGKGAWENAFHRGFSERTLLVGQINRSVGVEEFGDDLATNATWGDGAVRISSH